jgi:hypothetical protein
MSSLDVSDIRQAADHFLRVFANFDGEAFRATWSSEPIVFFPFDDTPETVNGRAAIEARFHRFLRKSELGHQGRRICTSTLEN